MGTGESKGWEKLSILRRDSICKKRFIFITIIVHKVNAFGVKKKILIVF